MSNLVAIFEEKKYYGTDANIILNKIREEVFTRQKQWERNTHYFGFSKSPQEKFKESDIQWFVLQPITVNIVNTVEIIY